MFKGTIVPQTAVANTSISLTQYANTNHKTSLVGNEIKLKTPGAWNIVSNIIITATSAGPISYTAYIDGVAIPGATSTVTVASGDTYTLHINDAVWTVPAASGFAGITFQLSSEATVVGGDAIIEYVR